MLFERLLVYDDRSPADAALNMAIDEALLEQTEEPTLRFYDWRQPSLSFGYFGKFSEIAPKTNGRELVRRWTGGGSVLHGADLTYSLAIPASHPTFTSGPAAIYAALHAAIRDALLAEGWNAQLADGNAPKISEACFANPVRDDVLLDGRKIAGAAQRRTRRGFLHQGSVQLADLSKTFRKCFTNALSPNVEWREIHGEILRRAEQLAQEKYGTKEWLQRW